MPTKKKVNESELTAAPASESPVKPAAKPRVRKTATAEAGATAPKAASRAKAPAATHKAPATKTKKAAPEVIEAAIAPTTATAAPVPAPASGTAFSATDHYEEIAREAYYLWERRGYAHGNAYGDWLEACEIVKARRS